VGAEDVVCGFREPGGVAKLEGDLEVRVLDERREMQESVEAVIVGCEVGWELEEERAELGCGLRWSEGSDELGERSAAFAQALEVGDALGSFEAEEEAGWSRVEPALELGWGGKGAEGVIDLD